MVDTIYIEEAVVMHERTRQILDRFPHAEKITCGRYAEVFNPKGQDFRLQKQRPSLILANKHEGHVLEAPQGYGVGSEENYYFSHMLNCVYDCRYCFLQGMYRSAHFVVFVNYEDFGGAIKERVAQSSAGVPWFFSGYDCDSLAYEPVTGFMRYCLDRFERLPGAWLEIRTKSTQVRGLLEREALDNVVVAFSFTPDDFSRVHEHGVPTVDKRIGAMAALQERGWKIGLRFDPMLNYSGSDHSYRQLFENIFTCLDHEQVHSASMGGFRMPAGFFKQIRKLYPQEPLFNHAMSDTDGMKSFPLATEQALFELLQGPAFTLATRGETVCMSDVKTVLVTGARLGIGRAITMRLLDQGCRVIGTSRWPGTFDLDHSGFRPLELDLGRISRQPEDLARFSECCGDVDAVVMNAGYGRFGSLEEFSPAQINELLMVNLLAQIQLVRALIVPLKRRSRGDIIFIGSEAALAGGKMGAVYSASKFGIRGFAQALRHECAGSGIKVGLINPGMVASSFFDDLGFEPGPAPENRIQPAQVADAVGYMLDSSANVVWDEVNLSPLNKVVTKKRR